MAENITRLTAAVELAEYEIIETWIDPTLGGAGLRVALPNGKIVSIIKNAMTHGAFEALDVTNGYDGYAAGGLSGADVEAYLRNLATE